jgi:TatA/E family protein of Tat protein translocase
MFGSIGFPELLVILSIALLVFGPKKLPEVGRSIGKALREFRKTSDEIKEKIEEEIQADEFREIKKDIDQVTNFKFDIDSEPENPYEHVETSPVESTEDTAPTEEAPEAPTEKADQDESGKKVT